MSSLVLVLITGVGLGALYFLIASGLSLIYGLMHVLNFAHGAFLTLSALVGWEVARRMDTSSWGGFLLSILAGAVVGAVFAAVTELALIRPLYERHIEQVLVTVGLSFAAVALFEGIWGTDPIYIKGPEWLVQTTDVLGARIPNTYWVLMLAAALVLAALVVFLRRTRQTLLIFAFIVTVIGGLGSLAGAAIASVIVAVLQQFANFFLGGTGDFIVVVLLAVVLLVRPRGLLGRAA